jgi:hypothetical protein
VESWPLLLPCLLTRWSSLQVLRLYDQPLENVVTTGVTTATVEAMEAALKEDLLRERESTGGKVLLVSSFD